METYEAIPIAEFDDLARRKQFREGPFISTLGDGYGEPYQPVRTVRGVLLDGRKVQAEKILA